MGNRGSTVWGVDGRFRQLYLPALRSFLQSAYQQMAHAVAPHGPGIRFQSGAPLKVGHRRGRGQSQSSTPADVTRLVATGSTAALCPSTA